MTDRAGAMCSLFLYTVSLGIFRHLNLNLRDPHVSEG